MEAVFLGLSPAWITLIIYIGVLCVIGFIGYRATKNLSDYILGGRSFGVTVTALSAGASDMSGWLLMGLPGAIFVYGLSKSWIGIGLFLGAWLNWTYIAGALRDKTEKLGNAQTLPEYFANRFPKHGKLLRSISAIVIVIFFTIYCASGVVASAKLLEASFSVDYTIGIWIGAAMTVTYVFFGGLFAVSWTDTLQAILMFLALLLVPFLAYMAIDDVSLASQTVMETKPHYTYLLNNIGVVSLLSSLAWGLGYFGQPHILIRFMAAKDSGRTMQKAKWVAISWMALCLIGSLSLGYFGGLFVAQSGISVTDPESIFLDLGIILSNPWIGGFLSAAVLSAIMSTLSSQLLIGSGSLTSDILPLFTGKTPSPEKAVKIGRGFLLLIALCAILLASDPGSSILDMVGYAWAGFGCSFGTVILMSLLSDKMMTSKGAIAGMISGAIMVILWESLDSALYSMIPAFITSILTIIIVSKMTRD
ncbi:MAG: sodium/proline symporter PutP [Pseudomonadota bacterium]